MPNCKVPKADKYYLSFGGGVYLLLRGRERVSFMLHTIVIWLAGLFAVLLVVGLVGSIIELVRAVSAFFRSLTGLSNTLQFRSDLLSVARGVVVSTKFDATRQPAAIAEALGIDLYLEDGTWSPLGMHVFGAWKQALMEMADDS